MGPQPACRRAAASCGIGRRFEPFLADELADGDKVPVLRAYVERWRWEVGKFFEGLPKDPSNDDLAAIAAGFPVFAVTPA